MGNIVVSFRGENWVESLTAKSEIEFLMRLDSILKIQIEKLRHRANLRPLDGILCLPDELVLKIMKTLDSRSLSRIGATCKKLKALADDDVLWEKLYLKDFTTIRDGNVSWRHLYAEAGRAKKERDRELRRTQSEPLVRLPPIGGLPLMQPHPMIDPRPVPGQMPGIIGGEYDLRPGMAIPGGMPGGIRGDPVVPGLLTDPDRGLRQDPDRPDFPTDLYGGPGFGIDGSFNPGFPGRGRGRGRGRRGMDPFGGFGPSGFM